MKKFTIKKIVIASSIHDAIRKEKKEPPSEIYQDYTYTHDKKSEIGFKKEEK